MATGLFSRATVTTVGLTCKAFLKIGFCSSVSVNGLDILLEALRSEEREKGRGVVTVANHLSTLDDPLIWGIMPWRSFLSERTTRWALGAADIIFTNPIFSAFFRNGQVLETFRGKGIYQPSVDTAVSKLNRGGWVHLFGEGKVYQPRDYREEHGMAHLARFKWGIGRMLMETALPPTVIPMWLTGFDKLMPEGRSIPYKFLPRPGVALSVTFGKPISAEKIRSALASIDRDPARVQVTPSSEVKHGGGWMGEAISRTVYTERYREREGKLWEEMARVRSEVTEIVRQEVEALGRSVSGARLGK
ncbi:acyltransferase-domain-containing protein [Gloeophyllum trabeum ATCC 11539]|uniref:Tafazzin family protein n=1 Tax=Gloeophyllum trabeum (strain ATCC 11539 / FP-39264 / Madison 617) TaxID=670483 RepID=S7Q182_GLOTA|nr:acyltransferase-domain-containing protein [Gloeophyllum trabeum ATCC 11539]EPQ53267.1 acyltransferase-domain-containing protein [Gloeophyllum trabeum ATCC 11539]